LLAQAPFLLGAFSRLIMQTARNTTLIHAHWSISGLCSLPAKHMDIPLVVTFHGSDFSGAGPGLVDKISHFVAHRADRIICVSTQLRDRALARGLPADRIRTIRNGIDLERFRPRRDRTCLADSPVADASPILILIGRLARIKGPERALTVFERCLEHLPRAGLVFVGDGPMRAELRNRVRKSERLTGRVWFAGVQPTNSIPDFLAAVDGLLMTSRFEGLPTCVMEAMAAGCPVISLPVGGVGEIIKDGRTGFMAAANDEAALQDALVRCFSVPGRREQVARNARQMAEHELSWSRCAREHRDLYEELL